MNPYLERNKDALLKEEKQRQRHLRRRDRSKALDTLGKIGTAAIAVHAIHPKGIIGAANDISKVGLSAKEALTNASKKMAATKGMEAKARTAGTIHKDIKDDFLTRFKKQTVTEGKDIELEKIRKGYDRFDQELRSRVINQKRHQSFNKLLDKAAKDSDISQKKIDTFREKYASRLGSIVSDTDEISTVRKLKKAGIETKEEQSSMLKLIQKVKDQEVVDDVELKQTGTKFKEKMLKGIIDERQSQSLDGKPRLDAKKRLSEGFLKLFGYKKATIEDVKSLDIEKGVNIQQETLDFMDKVLESGADASKFVVDDNLLVHKGKIISSHQAAGTKLALKNTFSDGILGGIMYQRDSMIMDSMESKPYHFMGIGKHQPALEHLDVVGDDYRLKQTLLGIGDKVYGINDPDTILESGRAFTSGKYGSAKRLMAQMANINAKDWDEKSWYESKTLGLEKHRETGTWGKVKSFFSKKKDPKWMKNKINRAYGEDFDEELAYELYDYLHINAPTVDAETLDKVTSISGIAEFRDLKFNTKQDLINSYKKIIGKSSVPEDLRGDIDVKIQNVFDSIHTQTRRGIGQKNVLVSESDAMRKEITKELIDVEGPIEIYSSLTALKNNLNQKQFDSLAINVGDNILSNKVAASGFNYKEPLKDSFSTDEFDLEDSIVSKAFTKLSDITHPKFGYGPEKNFANNFDGDVLALKQFDNTPKDWLNTFFAGKGNMQDVHRGTMMTYGISTRMNDLVRGVDMFGPLSLGLPDDDLGSTASFFGNAMAKRVIPGFVAFEGMRYISDYAHQTRLGDGYTLRQRHERGKASARMKVADFKESLPFVSSIGDTVGRVTPGSEGVSEVFHSIPYVGWGADYSGMFSGKTSEDWADYYESGTDPIRKGRWWPLGNTPWMGQDIQYHRPNSYKMAMAEPEYTDTLYGSKDDYWSRSFLPTPRHPTAPIKRFITDRYWLEEKHKETRPYPISRSMFDPNTPWGMPLNATVGNILKPQKSYGAGATKSSLEELYEDAYEEERILTRYHGGEMETVRYYPEDNLGTDSFGDVPVKTFQDSEVSSEHGIRQSATQAEINKTINTYGRRYKPGTRVQEGQFISDGHGTIKGAPVDYVAGDLQTIYLDGREEHLNDIGAINRAITSSEGHVDVVGKDTIEKAGQAIPYREPFTEGTLDMEVDDPRSLSQRLRRMNEATYYLAGSRGFLTRNLLGDNDYGQGTAVLETADMAFASSERFWRGGYGGRGGGYSEVFRRMFQKRPGLQTTVNNLPNVMPRWLPERFHTGDPYTIAGGEYRLPGEAYESLHQLHSDEYGTYGAVDRAAILADVAPWSDEFQLWIQRAREQDLTPEANQFLQQKLKESRKQRERHHITEYEFWGSDVDRDSAVIDNFIDGERFTVQGSDEIFRIAGIHGSLNVESEEGQQVVNILNEYMSPGSEVDLVTPTHHPGQQGDGSVPVVVGSGGVQINQLLRDAGLTPREESSDIQHHLETGPIGRAMGRSWELLSHARIPLLQNKVFNVNSAMEHYKYNYVYGKDFQSWGKPIEDLIKPTFRSAAAQNPIGATLTGGFAGVITGGFLGDLAGTLGKVGAAAGLTFSITRMAKEYSTGEAWIPEDARDKREIDKYMDRLEYIKNKRLYHQYSELARKEEGVDIEDVVGEMDEYYREIKEEERKLESFSRSISLNGLSTKGVFGRLYDKAKYLFTRDDSPSLSEVGQEAVDFTGGIYRGGLPNTDAVRTFINDEGRLQYSLNTQDDIINHKRSEINERLQEISNKEIIGELGEYSRKAIEYRDRARSTIVGLDEDSTYTQIFRALPREEREYFNYFSQEMDPDRQDEILEMVPEDLRRVYKQIWNRDSDYYDTEEEVAEYFSDYALPDEEWIGWKEGVDLDDSRKKLIENEGYDPMDFGMWMNNTVEEKLTPAPVSPGEDFRQSRARSINNARKQIEQMLSEFDIDDVMVEIEPTKDEGLTIDLNIEQDVTDKVKRQVQSAMTGI